MEKTISNTSTWHKMVFGALFMSFLLLSCKGNKEAQQDTHFPDSEIVDYEEHIETSNPDSTTVAGARSNLAKYEYSWTKSDQIPPILIIIDDFGYIKGDLLEDFAKLPSEVVFAILPDLPHTELAVQKASQSGREAIMHIPMQAKTSNVSPGTRFLKEGLDYEQVESMVTDFYRQMPSVIGANNHMGSSATSDPALMEKLMKALGKNDLSFVDSFTSPSSVAFAMARKMNVSAAKRDIFLDVPDNSDATIAAKVEGIGKFKGRLEPIVVITHCHSREKLRALQLFISQVKAMGVELISLSEALDGYAL